MERREARQGRGERGEVHIINEGGENGERVWQSTGRCSLSDNDCIHDSLFHYITLLMEYLYNIEFRSCLQRAKCKSESNI